MATLAYFKMSNSGGKTAQNTYMGHGSTDTDRDPCDPSKKVTHSTRRPIACSATNRWHCRWWRQH